MSTSLERSLERIGLSPREASIYLSAIRLGPTTPLRLASVSGIKRATVYNVLESLQAKGLVGIKLQGLKRVFVAEPPERLHAIVEERKAVVENILPDLRAIHRLDPSESSFKYFEGNEATKSAYEGMLSAVRPGEDYLIISHQPGVFQFDEKFFQSFIERRAKLAIKIRMLTTVTTLSKKHQQQQKRYNMQVRMLSEKTLLSTNLVIIPRKVLIQQLAQPVVTLVIENQSIVQLHRELFEMIWQKTV